jgi:putative transposase
MRVGQQKRVPVQGMGDKKTRHLFGGYHWNTDTVTWTTACKKNTETFIIFLEELLLQQCPTDRVILVLDNVSYHKSAAALAALSMFEERVEVIWLPKYCPELNPIERFWRYLKDQACANHLEDHIDQVIASAEKVLTRQNDTTAQDRYHVSKDF